MWCLILKYFLQCLGSESVGVVMVILGTLLGCSRRTKLLSDRRQDPWQQSWQVGAKINLMINIFTLCLRCFVIVVTGESWSAVKNCLVWDCLFCVLEAETRQRLLRTVKKEVGVFSSYRVGKTNTFLFVWSCTIHTAHREDSQVIPRVVKDWWDTYLSVLDVQSFSLTMTPEIDYLYNNLF